MSAAVGQTLKKRYEVRSFISQGGMGSVYLAHDRVLDVPVAVKELLDRTPEARAQFEREAKILARMAHPGLPRVTDWFMEGRGAFLVMDYIDGEDLQQHGRVDEATAVEWTLQILDVLAYIHGLDVVHRDLKPSNLRLNRSGRVMLVDFGIARQGALMTSPFARGAYTPAVAPPEQCTQSGRTGPESDLYALGVTMFFLLRGDYPPDAMSRLMGAPVPSVGRLDAVVTKAMALDPADRYPCAQAMAAELRGVVAAGRAAPPAVAAPVAPVAGVFRRDIRRL